MTQDEVLSLMQSSQSQADWSENCDKIRAAHNGEYPPYWLAEVVQSGLMAWVLGSEADETTFVTFPAS